MPDTRDNPSLRWKDVDQDGDDYVVEVDVLSQGGIMLTISVGRETTCLDLSDEQAKRIAVALMPPADSERREG